MRRVLSLAVFLASAVALADERPARLRAPDLSLESLVVTPEGVTVTVVNSGGPANGCYLELALYDKQTWNQVDTRRQTVKPLGTGERQAFEFPAEAAFAGKRFQLVVDSSERIGESNESNNASAKLDAPVAKGAPIRIPGKSAEAEEKAPPVRIPGKSEGRRPPPIRIGKDPAEAKTPHTPPPPIKVPGGEQQKKAPPADPGQPEIDLVAVSVSDNGNESVGTIRNDGPGTFSGYRTARLIREVMGGAHMLERKVYAEALVPRLAPGETWRLTAESLPKSKAATGYLYRLALDPVDDNPDNDWVEKSIKVVKFD